MSEDLRTEDHTCEDPIDNSQEINQECIRYFRETPGFHRLLAAIKEKYRSLGTLGGKIHLSNLKSEEKSALTGLLRRDYSRHSHAEIQVSAVLAALNNTKFQGVDFQEVLAGYWGEELISKKEELSIYNQQREEYFSRLAERLPSKAAGWLRETLVKKDNAYKTLITRYEQDPDGLSKDLEVVGAAVAQLPCLAGKKMQLPIFSSQLTADPHFFDRTMPARYLFIYALVHIFDEQKPTNAFTEAELLYKAGLFSTEIANYTISCGLLGYINENEIHQGWLGFYRSGESLQVSVENLSRLERVISPCGLVFVMENPAVFSALAERWNKKFVSSLPLVCVNGQVNLATFALLEMLVASGALLYYSGDFDPEGLLIADRLKKRFDEKLLLWRYSVADYRNSLSVQRLTAERLKQLQRLEDQSLKKVGAAMAEAKYAGYQEVLVAELWKDVQSLMPK
ncbi:MAG TPA: TIGR02679 family protein [Firmicutes bacterium]|jgi:uncharacterized protein (TIGR02679 family)|nr:TIGR02679 family protein [Bacillota bacterium]HBT18325.1 TIGR02679 family protein [Bacillota bacterium]